MTFVQAVLLGWGGVFIGIAMGPWGLLFVLGLVMVLHAILGWTP